jgi:glutamate racemase
MTGKHILIFDSGMGGLTVVRAIRQTGPDAHLTYAADNAAFPYGDWREDALVDRIVHVVGALNEITRPDIIVVACNTASTLALAALRKAVDRQFVGTVPAIKPAAAATRSNIIGVLATPGTVERDYTQALIHTFAYHCKVFLHGAPRLADMAEAKLKGTPPNLDDLRREIAPVFRERAGARTDTVVLGCTHYPLLLDDLKAAAPWPVTFIDPAPAIARRTMAVLAETRPKPTAPAAPHAGKVLFTAPRGISQPQLAAYAACGFTEHEVVDLPI